MSHYPGTVWWSITKHTRAGETFFRCTDLRTGKTTRHATKREATAQAKLIRADGLKRQ